MKCEICGETATMWVEKPPIETTIYDGHGRFPKRIVSCDACGPQAGYKILALLVANIRSDAD